MARRWAPVPIDSYLETIPDMLQSQMPARLVTAGLPAVVTWTYQDVLFDSDSQLPLVCVGAKWRHRAKGGGGSFEPLYATEIICAFPWLGTGDGYKNGAGMASIVEALMYYNIGSGYEDVVESSGIGMAAGQETSPQWQGGVWRGDVVGSLLYF